MNQQSRELITWDANFGDESLASTLVLPVKERNPRLLWLTGNTPPANRREAAPIGWCVHRDVNPFLDDVLTRLHYCTQWVEHTTETGEQEMVEYWLLNARWKDGVVQPVPCSLFVLARGVSDPAEMDEDQTLREGVAYGWEPLFDKEGQPIRKKNGKQKHRRRLKFRCYVHEVVSTVSEGIILQGFDEYFQVSLSGYLCDDMLTSLAMQYKSVAAYNGRLQALKKPLKTPFWALSNPLEPAEKPRTVFSEHGEAKSIMVMRSCIPAQVESISDAFLHAHRMPGPLQEIQSANSVVLHACDWSKKETLYLLGYESRPEPMFTSDSVPATRVESAA